MKNLKVFAAAGALLVLAGLAGFALRGWSSAPAAMADITTGTGITLIRPSCAALTGTGGYGGFVCMGDLKGTGQEWVIGGSSACAATASTAGCTFTILNPDGTKTVVQ